MMSGLLSIFNITPQCFEDEKHNLSVNELFYRVVRNRILPSNDGKYDYYKPGAFCIGKSKESSLNPPLIYRIHT